MRLKGYRILARRFRLPVGEIDIIARPSALVVAIEVKSRPSLGEAMEAISPRQQARIRRSAEMLIARHVDLHRLSVRFEAMLVIPWYLPVRIEDALHA